MLLPILALIALITSACYPAQVAIDNTYTKQEGVEVIYVAGGCFWGIEKLMQSIRGVVEATSGYANGKPSVVPTYDLVLTGETGYRETVRVEYKPDQISLDALIFAFYQVVDPTIENAQGYDIGTQYQTGIYYTDDTAKSTVERITALVKERYEEFFVEIEPLESFFQAEEYHQDYLVKNPMGYCSISRDEIAAITNIIVDPGNIRVPQTRISGDAHPTCNRCHPNRQVPKPHSGCLLGQSRRGSMWILFTGSLFSYSDKFESGQVGRVFSKGIDENAFVP